MPVPQFPEVIGGEISLWPVQRTMRRPVYVCQFSDGTEQRWRDAPALVEFSLTLEHLDSDALQEIGTFFDQVQGSRNEFEIVIGGQTFEHMILMDDSLVQTLTASGWAVQARCRQRRA